MRNLDISNLTNSFRSDPSGQVYDSILAELRAFGTNYILSTTGSSANERLQQAGTTTFGTMDVFHAWLWTDLRSIGAKPIDLIAQGGTDKVLEILGQIQYGVYS